MTYLLTNEQRVQLLKDNNIQYYATKNTIFINSLDVTNISDEVFKSLLMTVN